MINQAHDADLKNNGNEIKVFLIEETVLFNVGSTKRDYIRH